MIFSLLCTGTESYDASAIFHNTYSWAIWMYNIHMSVDFHIIIFLTKKKTEEKPQSATNYKSAYHNNCFCFNTLYFYSFAYILNGLDNHHSRFFSNNSNKKRKEARAINFVLNKLWFLLKSWKAHQSRWPLRIAEMAACFAWQKRNCVRMQFFKRS